MKDLLSSKKFKTNLFRWLFAYVGVLMLLTMVVTYSKYMTSLETKDESRPAMFVANFKNEVLECQGGVENTCDTLLYRPTTSIDYSFSLDTTGTEVKTYMITSIYVDDNFDIESLNIQGNMSIDFTSDTVENGNIESIDGEKIYKFADGTKAHIGFDIVTDKKKITIEETILPNNGSKRIYTVTIKYPYAKIDKNTDLGTIDKIIQVGYSATQVK